jgi:thioredoxin 1
MAPILAELRQTFAGRLNVQFIDVWENRPAGEQHNIRAIPTQIFFDASGHELFRHEGFYGREEILAKWKDLGFDFQVAPGAGS